MYIQYISVIVLYSIASKVTKAVLHTGINSRDFAAWFCIS